MIRELGAKVAKGFKVKGVPSSKETEKLALKEGIQLISLDDTRQIDLNIDGADEINPALQLIKGGGGALLREKIIAHNSKMNVIIADSGKLVETLGKFRLPIETIPFATSAIISELKGSGLHPLLRKTDGTTYRTDENNYIVDLDISGWHDLPELERLLRIPGIVETGLFLHTTDLVILGRKNAAVTLTGR
jgi:ribose 5-phosphate isomerase A